MKTVAVYLTFFLVGNGCGWIPVDGILNLVINERLGPHWLPNLLLMGGAVSIIVAILYATYIVRFPDRLPPRVERGFVTGIIVTSATVLLMQTLFWRVGAPTYPVVLLGNVLGYVVADATYCMVFPMIAANYAGWLVAPVRAGSDLSSVICNLAGQVQNPSGVRNLIPAWVLFLIYFIIVSASLATWLLVMHFHIGERADAGPDAGPRGGGEGGAGPGGAGHSSRGGGGAASESGSTASPGEGSGAHGSPEGSTASAERSIDGQRPVSKRAQMRHASWLLRHRLDGFACPRSLILPVTLGVLAEVLQWGLITEFSEIGASMTDPESCSGDEGAFVMRISTTANRVLIVLGSTFSSLPLCPRWLLVCLSSLQAVCVLLMLAAVFGWHRQLWITRAGQHLYITCYALTGGLEGYILTTAYRVIGDSQGVPLQLRRSAGNLLGLGSVLLVSLAEMLFGALGAHVVECVPPEATRS